MKVSNMTGRTGREVANQFIITDKVTDDGCGNIGHAKKVFQSYDSTIVSINHSGQVFLDAEKWDYSATTGKYRNQFLGEGIADTRAKIKSGEYKLVNLN